jgi:hypothetical protein
MLALPASPDNRSTALLSGTTQRATVAARRIMSLIPTSSAKPMRATSQRIPTESPLSIADEVFL